MIIIKEDKKNILTKLKQKDKKKFEIIFKTYYPRLCNYALHFIKDSDISKDIVQECFLHLWENAQTLCIKSIQAYLFTMVRNKCINYLSHEVVRDNYIN